MEHFDWLNAVQGIHQWYSLHIRDRSMFNMKFFRSKGLAASEFNILKFRRAKGLKGNYICYFNDH